MSRTTDEAEVAVRAESFTQLFHPLDPSPLRAKDLDAKVEEYVVGWVRELPSRARIVIVLQVPPTTANDPQASEIATAIQGYFTGRAERLRLDLRELFREGRRALMVGLPLLAGCVLASQAVRRSEGAATLTDVVSESLLILGWVANWRPLEIFLYAWWPIRRRLDLYRRLATARIEIRAQEMGGQEGSAP